MNYKVSYCVQCIIILSSLLYSIKTLSLDFALNQKLDILKVSYTKKLISDIQAGLNSCSIPDNLVLSIIKVESDFIVNAENDLSNDYGLMQINIWHVKHSKLDKYKLLQDAVYNIKHGCDILEWFYKTYQEHEAIMRYNCGTKKKCIELKSVKLYLKRVLEYKAALGGLNE